MQKLLKDKQFYKFCGYGFLKNLRFFDAFIILFFLEKGLSYTEIGTLYAARQIFINVFELPSGLFADTFGRKNALLFSFVSYIFSFLILNFFSNFWAFIFAFALYGLADAFRSGTHKGMIMDYLKLQNAENLKIQYYGQTRSWSQRGSAISSLIAGFMVFATGSFQNIFLFSIIPYVINFFLILSYPSELNRPIKAENNRKKLTLTFKSFVLAIKSPKVLKIINLSALHSAYLASVKDYIQPVLINTALLFPFFSNISQNKKNGLFVGIIYFIIYLLNAYASKFSFMFEKKKNISFITLSTGLIFGIISGISFVYGYLIISLLAFIMIFIIENIRKPVLTGFVADNVPNNILTSVLSAQSIWKTIITAFLSFLLGFLSDLYGIGNAIFYISSSILIISVLIFRK